MATSCRFVRVRPRSWRGLLFAALPLGAGGTLGADTIVVGSVMDATTQSPVVGAAVTIRKGAASLGADRTDRAGLFRLPFDVGSAPQAQNLKLFVDHDDYVKASEDVVVVSGRADRPSYRFDLLPASIAGCYQERDHAVVVGYFRPPASGPADSDFAARIRETLDRQLLPRIQQLEVFKSRPEVQPAARDCARARPKSDADYGGFARALHADVFLAGYVVPSGTRFKIEMSIGDRFDLQVPPPQASSPNVDLDDPAAARLSASAQAAILTALAAGYEKTRKPAECVEVTVAAERILGRLPPAIANYRRLCQAALGHNGLLRGGGP